MDDSLFFTLPLTILYAETHFRIPFIPSFLFRKVPEIIFDVPRRIQPGSNLPITLIINHIDKYPIEIIEIALTISQKTYPPKLYSFGNGSGYEIIHPFRKKMKAFIFSIDRSNLPEGEIYINTKLTAKKNKTILEILNDNLPTSSNLPYTCCVSNESLPGSTFCTFGDIHIHSQFSESHVEFGPPIRVIDRFAKAIGLDFIAITDHSYDLTCSMNNYLNVDPSMERWKQYRSELDASNFETIVIGGEEVSCRNTQNEIVHVGALGTHTYLPGSGDGARKNKSSEELTISESVKRIHEQNGIAFAAHPGAKKSFFQNLFLHRGAWSDSDTESNIDAMQAVNCGFSASWKRGKALWVRMLQKNIKVPLLAGNDAHGDFNRYRAIARPFVRISENFNRYMGYAKTGIYGKKGTKEEILDAVREGATFVTNGPFITIASSESPSDTIIGKKERLLSNTRLFVLAQSTSEFGPIREITVFSGRYGTDQPEQIVFRKQTDRPLFEMCLPVQGDTLQPPCYCRAEIRCGIAYETKGFAATSACFLI